MPNTRFDTLEAAIARHTQHQVDADGSRRNRAEQQRAVASQVLGQSAVWVSIPT